MASIGNLEGILDRYEAKGWLSKQLDAPEPYLEAETRSVCTHALLLTLDRAHRMAFILGVVMEVNSQEGSQILEITSDAYRKRLSRARSRIKDFLVKIAAYLILRTAAGAAAYCQPICKRAGLIPKNPYSYRNRVMRNQQPSWGDT
jgi:hypothetical protein